MEKKRFVIVLCIIHVIVLVFQCGIQLIYNNYRFGMEFYTECNESAVYCDQLVRATDYLQRQFSREDVAPSDISTWSFESALDHAILFGFGDMPLLEDVGKEYTILLERLRWQIFLTEGVPDPNMERYQRLFVDPEGAQKMSALKEQLDFMKVSFMEIHERYNEMSGWERCFTSWSKERKILSEKLRMPESLAAQNDTDF